jgi:hypothetical protein
MNITEPAVAERAPQPYVSIPRTVTTATISSAADELPGLFGWLADRQRLAWDKQDTPDGERWGCRLEVYPVNPAEQPDPAKWETELDFRLAG